MDLFATRPQVMKPWKPTHCTDCGAPHPTFSRDAGRATDPWRCRPCHERKPV